ncbi:Nuclear protein localization protein 4 like [Dissostichus eleginoides]|uniref:Nuclear protein localization protein 4 like n=1 Tax=Dissostichus eleginoides TaxID=100907 RepID=A0AAD9BY25_DISEL|nr:Nuclear protein localization protein 4 like [Dissostichus eleginoides]
MEAQMQRKSVCKRSFILQEYCQQFLMRGLQMKRSEVSPKAEAKPNPSMVQDGAEVSGFFRGQGNIPSLALQPDTMWLQRI